MSISAPRPNDASQWLEAKGMAKRRHRSNERGGRPVKPLEIPCAALEDVREVAGLTQTQLAQLMESSQGHISRLESKKDMLISSLEEYVCSMGGKLHIVVEISGRRMKLDLRDTRGTKRPRKSRVPTVT